jgi:hypothetical protein
MDPQCEGRWAIVLSGGKPPLFWRHDLAALDEVWRLIRRTCPGAQVVWLDQSSGAHGGQADRANDPNPSLRCGGCMGVVSVIAGMRPEIWRGSLNCAPVVKRGRPCDGLEV